MLIDMGVLEGDYHDDGQRIVGLMHPSVDPMADIIEATYPENFLMPSQVLHNFAMAVLASCNTLRAHKEKLCL